MIKSGTTLFKEILTDGKLENKVFSPLSLQLALDMLSKVEELGLEQELRELLDNMNFSKDAVLKMIEVLADSPSTVLVRNSFWMREDIPLKPIDYEGCDFFKEDFESRKTKRKVDAWVEESTKGLIDKLEIDLKGNLALIISVLYLNCEWVNAFATPRMEYEFTLLNGKKVYTYYLAKEKKEPIYYYSNDKFHAAGLPYKDERLRFELYMPHQENDFDSFLSGLDEVDLFGVNEKFEKVESYRLSFPKFDTKHELGLQKILKQLGFSELFSTPFLSEIVQDNFINVHERGTEAATVTYSVVAGSKGIPKRDVVFIADRPFLYLIRDRVSNTILYIGILTNPPSIPYEKTEWYYQENQHNWIGKWMRFKATIKHYLSFGDS